MWKFQYVQKHVGGRRAAEEAAELVNVILSHPQPLPCTAGAGKLPSPFFLLPAHPLPSLPVRNPRLQGQREKRRERLLPVIGNHSNAELGSGGRSWLQGCGLRGSPTLLAALSPELHLLLHRDPALSFCIVMVLTSSLCSLPW